MRRPLGRRHPVPDRRGGRGPRGRSKGFVSALSGGGPWGGRRATTRRGESKVFDSPHRIERPPSVTLCDPCELRVISATRREEECGQGELMDRGGGWARRGCLRSGALAHIVPTVVRRAGGGNMLIGERRTADR